MNDFTVGSLFSGIGGLDLGLERANMRVIWQSEIDPYACRVLAKHWPGVPNLGDCTTVDWSGVEVPDLVCGGFPCQPVSKAGRRRGLSDERWLWPEVARCVGVLRPRFLLLENTPGLSLPYESPRGSGDWFPAALETVLGDLAALGYDAEWDCLPAAAVGAPHLRDRVFILAYPDDGGCVHRPPYVFSAEAGVDALREPVPSGADVADTDSARLSHVQGGAAVTERARVRAPGDPGRRDPEPILGGSLDGVPAWLDGSWESGLARISEGVPDRVSRLRALGNAVVPQVAEWIGHRIMRSVDSL